MPFKCFKGKAVSNKFYYNDGVIYFITYAFKRPKGDIYALFYINKGGDWLLVDWVNA